MARAAVRAGGGRRCARSRRRSCRGRCQRRCGNASASVAPGTWIKDLADLRHQPSVSPAAPGLAPGRRRARGPVGRGGRRVSVCAERLQQAVAACTACNSLRSRRAPPAPRPRWAAGASATSCPSSTPSDERRPRRSRALPAGLLDQSQQAADRPLDYAVIVGGGHGHDLSAPIASPACSEPPGSRRAGRGRALTAHQPRHRRHRAQAGLVV
jgi:hypothetical protein